MTSDEFIKDAIERGARDGPSALDLVAKAVFLISEAEVECDMGPIDAFVERRDGAALRETAAAFRLVGAAEIAKELETIAASLPDVEDDLLEQVGTLITDRVGYDYESIRRTVERAEKTTP